MYHATDYNVALHRYLGHGACSYSLLPPPDDLQLEKKLSPEIFFCEFGPLEVKLRCLGAVVHAE